MSIIGIVAVDQNQAIGKDGRLPWHYSADMKFFKQTTIGNSVVMGRHTWLTLKGPLKDRQNIVLSRGEDLPAQDSLIVMRDVASVLDLVSNQDQHLFVIGGAQVYESFLPHIDRWMVTEVPLAVAGADTFMPANFLDGFEMFELRQLDAGLRVKFYERKELGGNLNCKTVRRCQGNEVSTGSGSDRVSTSAKVQIAEAHPVAIAPVLTSFI